MIALARISLAALLVLPAVSCAQDKTAPQRRPAQNLLGHRRGELASAQDRQPETPAEPDQGKPGKDIRRLESVTWNSVKHELTWTISKGQKDGNSYKTNSSNNYEINMDDATMTFNSETRRFSKEEASNVHVLMDLIAKYAVDSTVWWDEGHGEPVDGKPKPGKESVAVVHVSTRPLDSRVLQQRIDELQRKLTELKLLQSVLEPSTPLRPASY